MPRGPRSHFVEKVLTNYSPGIRSSCHVFRVRMWNPAFGKWWTNSPGNFIGRSFVEWTEPTWLIPLKSAYRSWTTLSLDLHYLCPGGTNFTSATTRRVSQRSGSFAKH